MKNRINPHIGDCPVSDVNNAYWLGHAGDSMDDLYGMVKDKTASRKRKAEEFGNGFELPSAVSCTECTEKAAQNEFSQSCVSC